MNENAEKKLNEVVLYTLTDLEPLLGVSHRTLMEYARKGKLKAVKIGGKWRVTDENLRRFINGEPQI